MPGFSTGYKVGLVDERFFDLGEFLDDSRICAMLVDEIHIPTPQAKSLVDNEKYIVELCNLDASLRESGCVYMYG